MLVPGVYRRLTCRGHAGSEGETISEPAKTWDAMSPKRGKASLLAASAAVGFSLSVSGYAATAASEFGIYREVEPPALEINREPAVCARIRDLYRSTYLSGEEHISLKGAI